MKTTFTKLLADFAGHGADIIRQYVVEQAGSQFTVQLLADGILQQTQTITAGQMERLVSILRDGGYTERAET